MAPFTALPPQLLLGILKILPDLCSLHNFRCASATVNRILQEDRIAAEVVEKILSGGSTLVSNQFLIRTTCLVVWGPHPENVQLDTLEGIREFLYGFKEQYGNSFGTQPDLPGSLPMTTWHGLAPVAILRMVSLAAQIQHFVHYCFNSLLDRVLASRPRRPTDHSLTYREYDKELQRASGTRQVFRPPEPPEPPSERFVPRSAATSLPSWGEQQLLEHAAWSFALYGLLLSRLAKTVGSGPMLKDLSFQKFWQQRWESSPCLAAIQQCNPMNATRISQVTKGRTGWVSEMTCSADSDELREYRALEPWVDPSSETQQILYGEPDRLRRPIPRRSEKFAEKYTRWIGWSPIYGAAHESWDSLGFSIWSTKRMAALGFMINADEEIKNQIAGINTSFGIVELHDSFAWRSVMTSDQVDRMKQRRETKWVTKVWKG